MSPNLRELDLGVFYDAPGTELAKNVLLPALSASIRYDRVSSYFSLQSLVSIGVGLENLVANDGKMRLLMGLHDVHGELVQAVEHSSADELLRDLRARILDGVTRLSDELARDRVRATALMLRDGQLEVRCVGYRLPEGLAGIFHNKRLVFVDRNGDVVTATGSPNETGAGLGGNFEELTLHMSWNGPEYTRAHTDRFEEVWAGQDDRLMTLPLDARFANDLLHALNGTSSSNPAPVSGARLALDLVGSSPLLGALNSSLAPMYPHQERAFVEVCSRWPIRAILADEVGLGKTYEAASVISFALTHCEVDRVVVLAPPTLLRQWQDELSGAFRLDFWRYDSTRREFISPRGETRTTADGPFRGEYPALTIVSRDLARGTRRTGHVFEDASVFPDMVVVDEAHAVRKARSTSDVRESLVGAMLRDVLERVPHALFLTATPLQVGATELHDAMELLGVPFGFDERAYSDSLELLAIGPDGLAELTRAGEAAGFVRQFIDQYGLMLQSEEYELKAQLDKDARTGDLYTMGASAQARWPRLYELFLRTHPAATMCVRNTRETLAAIGYVFPERRFQSIECEAGEDVRRLLNTLGTYLGSHLGMVEAELYPERPAAVGFVRSTYNQRAASSLVAVRASLERRLARIEALLRLAEWSEDSADEDHLDVSGVATGRPDSVLLRSPSVRQACSIEAADINSLLGMLGALSPDARAVDPKLQKAIEVASDFAADGKKVLLFSRYTDTVDGLIASYREQNGAHASYGVYTGGGALVRSAAADLRGDKSLVTEALSSGAVDIVFCSDAASEGLNLQAASVLINVDVPWNPARLEQRIGRIARLGQKAHIVDVINLWYPDSVEARIYERVLKRKETMELALGTFPEIVGSAIRSAVESRGEGWLGAGVLDALNGARARSEMDALTALWSAYSVRAREGGSAGLRSRLADALRSIASDRGSAAPVELVRPATTATTDPVLGPGLTLHRKWLEWMEALEPNCDPAVRGRLGVLTRAGQPLLFALKDGSWVKVLLPAAIPDVYRALYLAEPVILDQYVYLEMRDGEVSSLHRSPEERWWPTTEAMSIPVPESLQKPQVPAWADSSQPLTFRAITS